MSRFLSAHWFLPSILVMVAALAWPVPFDISAQSLPRATELRIFVPSTDLRIARRAHGACWIGSLSNQNRRDAWRCTTGNIILDPCFDSAARDPNTVVCVDSPWARSAVLLRLTEPLPVAAGNAGWEHPELPWALELANRDRCELATGATFTVRDLRANYACATGAWVIGEVDRRRPIWSVFYLRSRASPALPTVGVRVAWY
jgi:hypothetical protein